MNYTLKKSVMQGANPLKWRSTHDNCKPHARCKQIHKCEVCHKIHATKQLHKHLDHITDKKLKKFKFAKYITITPKDLVKDFEIHNSNIDHYINFLTKTSNRRSKKHPLYNSEYISFKEITQSKGNKELLPHIHMILLTNNENLLFENLLFDFDIRDIQINLNDKYTNDYKNPLTQTLKKIFAYSTKADKKRISYERVFNTSKGKSDIKISSIFKTKSKKSHILIPIHIEMIRKIKQACRLGTSKAKAKHSLYKQQKGNINTLAVHAHALKTQRKIKRLQNEKKILIARAEAKLKRFSVRSRRVKE